MMEYWWVWLATAFLCFVPYLHYKWKQRTQMQAQFLPIIGCVLVCFNMIGIVSAVLGIISGLIRLFLWKVGG
jgi:hypothetical protein